MVSGKPPRHSRPKNDPVTIDLEARDETPREAVDAPIDTGATPTGASDPEITKPGEPEASPVPEGMAAAAPADSIADINTAGTPAPESETVQTEDAAQPDADRAETATPATEAPKEEVAATRPAPVQKSPAFASLAAVGILGGLIALAGAGALQYGGILPGIGPEQRSSSDTSGLSSDIAALKAEVARLSTGTPVVADGALEKRIADLEAAQGSAGQSGEAQAAIDALKAALAQSTQDIAALKAELATVKQSQSDNAAAVETRLTQAETKLDEPRQDVSMAHAIAVAALKTAIDRGGPFLGELNTLAGIRSDDPAVAALQPHASVGILSRAELVRRMPATADAILNAINQPVQGEGWTDRLLSSAMSVVKVRPVGNIEGDAPEAIVARMEDKLRNGDLKGAELEWQTLPEAGKAASTDFHSALQTRLEVETIVSTALTDAVNGKG
ncbi:mitofilin family membrane protein [Rhizobium sp. RU36D]|uniref:COG4223 family protein n=1 Tax=Rhizobium sp. RU36D TaxID=1907415 RepID=UPI0009D8E567|nr:mitofilin family membrane protein [Rhizobium sp. RU36D]SMC76980.1 Uncharacterized conserved protein [Rhizobium sp. RU36D]